MSTPTPAPTRVAVVGAGFMGQRYAQIVADTPGATLAAVCDRDPQAAHAATGATGATVVGDHRELLSRDLADAAVVALPEHAQVGPLLELADAGLHLLAEKPVASTPEDADRLEAGLAGTAGVHAAAHLLRADPRYQHAADVCHDPAFGDVVHISATRRSRVGTAGRVAGRTSLLYYLGVHDLDVIAWLAGSPVTRVHAISRRPSAWPLAADASILGLVECANGTVAQLELTWAIPDSHPVGLEASVTVVGTGGSVRIGGGDEVLVSDGAGERTLDALHWPLANGRVVGTLRYQVEQWLRAVDGRATVAASVEDGLAAARVAFAFERSLATGLPAEVTR